MSDDGSDHFQATRVAILNDWIATMRHELRDERLGEAPDLGDLKRQMLVACERLLSIDDAEDFDLTGDVDAHSNEPVSEDKVGKAFATAANRAAQRSRAKHPRKPVEYDLARKLFNKHGAPVSNAKRIELEKQIANECGVERKTAAAWISEFTGVDAGK